MQVPTGILWFLYMVTEFIKNNAILHAQKIYISPIFFSKAFSVTTFVSLWYHIKAASPAFETVSYKKK